MTETVLAGGQTRQGRGRVRDRRTAARESRAEAAETLREERAVDALAEEARAWLGKLSAEWWAARPEAVQARAWRRWAEAVRVELLTLGAPVPTAHLAWGLLISARLSDPAVAEAVRKRAEGVDALIARMAERAKWARSRTGRPEDRGWEKRVQAYRRGEIRGGWKAMYAHIEESGRVRVEAMIAAGVPVERAVEIENDRQRSAVFGAGSR